MSLLEIFLIGIVLATCSYASYTDVEFKKIGNRCTYGLVLLGLLCQGLFAYLGLTTLPRLLWLLLGGLAAAFLMYYLDIWSPGDSKLFWGVSVALPPTLYTFGRWRYPPFVVVVNTFVPYFMLMTVYLLARTSWRQKLHVLQTTLAPRLLGRFFLSLVCFGGLSALISRWLPFDLDYFSNIILFVVLLALFDRLVVKERQLYFLLPFSAVSALLALDAPAYFLTFMAVTAGLFIALRFFVASLGDFVFVHEIPVRDLKAGAVPAHLIVRDREGKYRTQEVSFSSFVSIASRPRDAEVVMDIAPEGLSPEKVAELKQLARVGHFAAFGERVKIQQAMPFAPIVLAGVVLTVLCRGVFIERLLALFLR
jgi:Flp pilus assembly protein protease CpaA